MEFARLLREWIAILEAEYRIDAEATPISEEGLQELQAHLGTSLPAQYEELLRVGDGFFAGAAGNLFPDGSTRQLSRLAISRDPAYGIEIWPELDIPYINSGPADWSRLVLIAEGSDGRDLAVVAGGAADGAVVVVNFDRFEWVARSL